MKKSVKLPKQAKTKKDLKKPVRSKKPAKTEVSPKNDRVESPVTAPFRPAGYKHPGGRPPKYTTVPELEKVIDDYFLLCWTQKLDMFGNKIFEKEKGKKTEIPVMVQYKPYTISGLARTLGMTRETLSQYEKKDKFSDTIKRAKQMCEQYAEESLFIGKNPTGAIFNLKNNYGWKDKTETEHSGNLVWREEPPK